MFAPWCYLARVVSWSRPALIACTDPYGASLPVPTWVWRLLAPDRITHIVQAELLAIIIAYWSFGARLRGRSVVHWCDNTGAIAAATGGGASRFPGADVLTCVLHLLLLGLRCRVHFEFVPSEANIADWPTRADKVGLIPETGLSGPP